MMKNKKHLPFALTNEEKVSEKLLINENKSNNFDVKSNKQIEEMAKTICKHYNTEKCTKCGEYPYCSVGLSAEALYNAGYRKQSENTVELPCKVGDTIYLPWQYDGVKAVAFLTVKHIIISEHRSCIRTDFFTDDEGFWEQFNGGEFNFSDFGNKVFVSKDEAEKALAKMKGGEE